MRLPDFPTRLNRLVDQTTALIPPGPLIGGSGVFIARDLVLTCAHVLAAQDGSPAPKLVGLSAFGVDLKGTVLYRAPARYGGQGLWPAPDLAIVEVRDPPEHGRWLTPTESPAGSPGLRLYVSGHSQVYSPSIQPGGRWAHFDQFEGGLLRLADCELPPGTSGGAVLDLENAELCGVVKSARMPNARLGGLAVPIAQLRSAFPGVWQRSLQSPHPEWVALREAVRDQFDPTARLCESDEWDRLNRTAAQLSLDQPRFTDLYARFCGPFPPVPERPLGSVRDLFRAMLNTNPDPGRLHPVIGVVEELAVQTDAPNRSYLHALAGRLALRLEPLTQPAFLARARIGQAASRQGGLPADPAILTIRIDRERIGEKQCTYINAWIRRSRDAPTISVYAADEALPGAPDHQLGGQLMGVCQTIIKRCLPDLPSGELIIELAVPRSLLAVTEVERWHLGDPARPLGVNHGVALRCTDRDEDAEYAWQNRSELLASAMLAGPDTLAHFDCADSRSPAQLNGALQSRRGLVGVSLSAGWRGSRLPGAMIAALNNGVPAIFWRRGFCPEHPPEAGQNNQAAEQSCVGGQFGRRLAEQLAGQAAWRAPVVVRGLRAEAAGLARLDDSHPGHDLALLWDDQTRQPWAEGQERQLFEPREGDV